MSKKTEPNKFSRRKFVKGMGTGFLGSYVIPSSLSQITQKIKDETGYSNQGLQQLELIVNGKKRNVMVLPQTTLASVLRDQLELTGTKTACKHGECGACTVLLNGEAVYSCLMLALDAEGKKVTTIEGLMKGEDINSVQQSFVKNDGLQCGFCTPGQVMAAQALLLKNPAAKREDILKGMSGNLCRCGAYPNIIKSVLAVSGK